MHHALNPGDVVENGFVAVGCVLAVELSHKLFVQQPKDIGVLAVLQFKRFEAIERGHGIGRTQQIDKQIDIHPRARPPVFPFGGGFGT